MNWQKLLAELMASGYTQAVIAARCGVAQTTVSDLYNRRTKEPSWGFGSRLLAMHSAKARKPRTRRATAAA